MNSFSTLLRTTPVRIALAVVAVIALGGISYYLIESAPPKVTYAAVTKGTVTEDITATGIVTPVQNPTLSFEIGGQVRSVRATVGQQVAAGTLLAALDTSVLGANLQAAQARLSALEAGPRGVDVAGQQTAVSSAQLALSNTYSNYPQTLVSTEAQAQSAITTKIDPLFDQSYRASPALLFTTNTSLTKVTADQERVTLGATFTQWQNELGVATSSSVSASQLQTLTTQSLAHLNQERTFINDVITAITDAQLGTTFTQAQQTAAYAQANTALDTVNGLISSLTAASQSISSQQYSVQSAQAQLNQSLAGATTQDIQAQQAAVAAIEAQIGQQEIVAPFAGTIASVNIKAGDVVSATTPAITLIPNGSFEVDVYVAETDLAALKVGNAADITLDAYGTGRTFPATIASIDASPSTQSDNTQGYKVTLIFASADPAIANGMHANATIHAGSAQNVLLVPKAAIITDGTHSFVLKQSASGLVKTPVTVGLSNTTQTQIVSGLAEGDQVSAVGAQ